MVAHLPHQRYRSTSPGSTAAVNSMEDITTHPSILYTTNGTQSKVAVAERTNKKKHILDSNKALSASSNSFGCVPSSSQKGIKINTKRIRVVPLMTTRRSVGPSEVDSLGLPLGMSIAAVVAQVVDRKNAAGENLSIDYLSKICILAVRESIRHIFGDKFDNFLTNFEKSFRSTLMTLRSISDTPRNVDEQVQIPRFRRCSCSKPSKSFPLEKLKNPICFQKSADEFKSLSCSEEHNQVLGSSCPSSRSHTYPPMEEMKTSRELVLNDINDGPRLSCSHFTLSTVEKSVMEQTRSNDLKMFEIGLMMKKMQLKEKQLELNSSANLLERWKLSMGFSKACFKAEKFKTQLHDSRQAELLKKCLDFLVAGLVVMLFSLGYSMYVYSHRRIIEVTEACSPHTASKSWWMPKSMATLNTGLMLLKCQIQVLSRMLFGVVMIGAIAFLLIQRSSASHPTMPVTFILLLLGVVCGYAGKLCIDTLGGSGSHWLVYWEALCTLHFFSNVFTSYLNAALNGPIAVVDRAGGSGPLVIPYWVRRAVFFGALLMVPMFGGFMPFAGPREWFEHFRSGALGFLKMDGD